MCEVVSVNELVDLVRDKATKNKVDAPYIGLEHIESISGEIIRYGNVADSTSTNGVFSRNDILFGKLRPRLRKCALAPVDGYCSTDILVLRAKDNVIAEYAYRIMSSEQIFSQAINTEEGTKMPRTSWEKISDILVWCPHVQEQQAIATILDTMDEAIRRTEAVLAKLRQVKAGMLHDLLTRGLDENGELRDPIRHPEQFKDSPLGRIPKDWESYTLGSIGSWVGGHTPSKGVDKYWRGGEVVWITPKDVKGQILHDSQDHLTVQAVNATGLLLFPKNSIFIVFRSGILKHSLPVSTCITPFTINQDLKVLVSNRGIVSEYISFFLEKESEAIINTAVKSGTTVESIDRSIFECIPIPLPSENEQKIIIERIKSVTNRLEREVISKQKLLSIKQGLMHDLLTGRVRVPPQLLEAMP